LIYICNRKKFQLDQKKKIFIEKIGVRVEQMGHPPLSGRLFGALLLADPPYLTFAQLCETLSASKSSISNSLNFLMQDNASVVEYFTQPGDRKRYFKISTENWKKHLNNIPVEFEINNQILKEILNYREQHQLDQEFTQDLKEILSFYQYIVKKLPQLFEEWNQSNKMNS